MDNYVEKVTLISFAGARSLVEGDIYRFRNT